MYWTFKYHFLHWESVWTTQISNGNAFYIHIHKILSKFLYIGKILGSRLYSTPANSTILVEFFTLRRYRNNKKFWCKFYLLFHLIFSYISYNGKISGYFHFCSHFCKCSIQDIEKAQGQQWFLMWSDLSIYIVSGRI